jgi:hypothetical protein
MRLAGTAEEPAAHWHLEGQSGGLSWFRDWLVDTPSAWPADTRVRVVRGGRRRYGCCGGHFYVAAVAAVALGLTTTLLTAASFAVFLRARHRVP